MLFFGSMVRNNNWLVFLRKGLKLYFLRHFWFGPLRFSLSQSKKIAVLDELLS